MTDRRPAHGIRRIGEEDRGTSVVVNYVLALGIVTLLGAGLFVATDDLVDRERERAVESELTVVGNEVAGELTRVDNLARLGGTETASVTVDLPNRVAGSSYVLAVEQSGDRVLVTLSSSAPDVTVTVGLRTETTVTTARTDGGTVAIRYDPSTDRLEVRDAG